MIVHWVASMALLCVAMFFALALATHAAIFDDGNDRHFINELREKDPAKLSAEEKAILAAADKVGIIRVCDGRSGSNAFFLNYGGRPAVLTSGHMLVATTGKLRCGETQAMKAFYYPNARYYDPENKDNRYALTRRTLIYPPINLSGIVGVPSTMKSREDWLVFLLDTDITADMMPDGSERGFLVGSAEGASSGSLTMIGVAPDMAEGDRTLFQRGCAYVLKDGFVLHNCDTVKGSSGSLLGVYEDGEIRIRGVHNFANMGNEKLPPELTTLDAIWNGGTSIETILADADKPHPELLAYDIQLKLSRSGCYSGKLDNRWGPGSRKALAAFAVAAGVTLPGTEPSPDLLTAVEKAAPEGTEVCR